MGPLEKEIPNLETIISEFMLNQWLFLVPLKGGRWHSPPIGSIYHLYIAFWGVI